MSRDKDSKLSKYQPFGRPMSMTEAENAELWSRHPAFVTSGFEAAYRQQLANAQVVVESAKVYAEANWRAVTDWSALDVDIVDNTGTKTVYYNHVRHEQLRAEQKVRSDERFEERRRKAEAEGRKIKRVVAEADKPDTTIGKLFAKIDRERAEQHNPITSLTDVVLDPTDGDFSLTINGRDHLWIDDESVLTIAGYIEEQLNQQPTI